MAYARFMTSAQQVSEFESLLPHLMSVAYRLTGTVADAEDIVQDAWLRWHGQDGAITDLRAWLTTVVSRLGLPVPAATSCPKPPARPPGKAPLPGMMRNVPGSLKLTSSVHSKRSGARIRGAAL